MNWKECISLSYEYELGDRFSWPPHDSGFDCSPEAFTISDVWGAVGWFWTYPGDWMLSQEPLRTFFELEMPVAGHWLSVVVGWVVLFIVLRLA